ncbi:MAG: EAL domain-containing protein [Coriobacteriales bacterium]|nr:EAL domain-containing protein [Coriobacteriales bacterium]
MQSGNIKRQQLVLVVDDFEANRRALHAILQNSYEILFAQNGQEALELMGEHAQRLSIVLLDLIMPVMSGFAVLEHMRANEQLSRIPVIALTAEKSAELRALQMGAVDSITKPFDSPEVILARVGRIIELSEGRQLISAAENDELTGLYNRSFFFEYANRIVQYQPDACMDAVAINIEHFHTINDVNGREFGDEVLRCIADEIRAFLSETEGIASRFGADRFSIYCLPQSSYRPLLNRLQGKVNGLSPNVSIRLRMGVNRWHEGVDPVLLFDRARAACDMVRGNYQNPLMMYDDAMHRREQLNQRLLNDLPRAVAQSELRVFYQAKYDVQQTPPKLNSAEALVRWQHPELGLISPGVFVPLFEGNGLINIVDNFVWEQAARQVAAWREKFGTTIPVSVNLSRSDVFDPQLEDKLAQLVEHNQLSFSDIKLELTESAYTDDAELLLSVIRSLRERGFEIEMDDFGSGYSSLNMLSDMPIDVLKMDMQFVRNIEKSETDRRLVELILDIARYLKVLVVAEGVETQGELDILRDGGCNLVQGYYFSRPLPPADFEKLIERELGQSR